MSAFEPYQHGNLLVKRSAAQDEYGLTVVGCGKWTCLQCAPQLKARLKRNIIRGNPNKFLTLTVNPKIGNNSLHRRELLAEAWKTLVQRIKDRFKFPELASYVVVEATQKGEPHFHIALRCGYIPQQWISDQMRDLIDAPIVFIEQIKNVRGAARYLAKYLASEPPEWKGKRRAWPSFKWAPKLEKKPSAFRFIEGSWSYVRTTLSEYLKECLPRHLTVYLSTDRFAYATREEIWRAKGVQISAAS